MARCTEHLNESILSNYSTVLCIGRRCNRAVSSERYTRWRITKGEKVQIKKYIGSRSLNWQVHGYFQLVVDVLVKMSDFRLKYLISSKHI